uniref:Uncharacterized protein n=2 Tax=Chenopodium quinoa TaxID=63459 RepID=A0A803M6X2_CHEQI
MLVPLRLVAGNRKPSFLTRLPSGIIAATVAVCGFSASILTFWFYVRCQGTDSGETTSRRTRLVIVLCFLMLVIITACCGAIIIYLQVAPRQVPLVNYNTNDFIRNGRSVGYQTGSFVRNMLIQRGFLESQLKSYSNEKELVNLLSKGSKGGGVDAAIDETPYLKVFVAERCNVYTLVPSAALHADGFRFAFRKESRADLVRDISIATLKVTNNDEQLRNIKDRTIGDLESCRENPTDATQLINWKPSMWILITGIAGVLALMLVCCPVYFECYKSNTSY